jgi:hypothetical protein
VLQADLHQLGYNELNVRVGPPKVVSPATRKRLLREMGFSAIADGAKLGTVPRWVRLRKGIHEDDLAMVVSADGDHMDILVVPRLLRRPDDLPTLAAKISGSARFPSGHFNPSLLRAYFKDNQYTLKESWITSWSVLVIQPADNWHDANFEATTLLNYAPCGLALFELLSVRNAKDEAQDWDPTYSEITTFGPWLLEGLFDGKGTNDNPEHGVHPDSPLAAFQLITRRQVVDHVKRAVEGHWDINKGALVVVLGGEVRGLKARVFRTFPHLHVASIVSVQEALTITVPIADLDRWLEPGDAVEFVAQGQALLGLVFMVEEEAVTTTMECLPLQVAHVFVKSDGRQLVSVPMCDL